MSQVKRLAEILFTAGCPLYDETGICSFTPALVATLGVIGLGAVTGYIEPVLFPGLAVLLVVMLYRLSR